jgi:arabinogalactan oligomer/maltooligosaccharide transport system substrate-binding protein
VKTGAPTGGHNLAIYAGSKNLDASYEFVKFMTSTDSLALMSGELGLIPPRASAFERPEVQGNADVAVFKPVMDTAVPRPWIPEGGLLFQPLLEGYQDLVGDKTTPADMVKTVETKYRELFKDWS